MSVTIKPENLEAWNSAVVLNAELHRLLCAMRDHGPMNTDQMLRHCLRPDELSVLIAADVRLRLSRHTVEAFALYADEAGDPQRMRKAIEQWRWAVELMREVFEWPQLAPGLRKLAEQRSAFLIDCATDLGWVREARFPHRWQLSSAGLGAIDWLWHTQMDEPII